MDYIKILQSAILAISSKCIAIKITLFWKDKIAKKTALENFSKGQ